MNNRIVIVGATSAMAEHCARLWAQESAKDFVLLGRNPEKLKCIAQDLRVRNPESTTDVQTTDFLSASGIQEWVNQVVLGGTPNIVLIAHGSLPDQRSCEQDLQLCKETIAINGLSTVLFAEAFAGHLQRAGHGTLAIIGSVAGDRGRKSNYVYGAAKGLVTRYAQGLQHRFAETNVKVVLIKPGPTDTPMTTKLKGKSARLADVEEVARAILGGIERGTPVIYTPAKWKIIMLGISHIPYIIFNRMDI